ncbi:DEAD/DEAH box helicase family protein [Prosthecochloris sp. SCSIO W1101]|uniref:DEAD/DEAH box helicase family protein n=1 Tax=Prosthecochloris sp. SCSIO W1101 TaxID=2992242 RepID=UPI00223CB232|nr:DEAD/DEAH box helicase family protein [Prosthecochloris sp. SCSIO W1101]UZJ41422.1 DEAD/DEAH box helicase family protein [Prosthecochloris sp. SCSIO W1101]
MARRKARELQPHKFRDKLLLNHWLISLFGIDPLADNILEGRKVRPFHMLAGPIKDARLEGLDKDNLHYFYHYLGDSPLFSIADVEDDRFRISRDMLLGYEQNIVSHTSAVNEKRHRPVVWKYFQWLTLLFTEIYLDRFFDDREGLLGELNEFVDRFNRHWANKGRLYAPVPQYHEDDLNKLCLQNATGSGKTLLMHVNLLQYRHYAERSGKGRDLSRVILLTPNERLSEQHIDEFRQSGLIAAHFAQEGHNLFTQGNGLKRVDVLEITKLGDQEGPNTIATRSLGDQNLLLVDEGHRGMSGKEEGVWFKRRSDLCSKGFTFEYSATFEQAVQASGNDDFEDAYAKAVLFDYSYRWFYEDGFGKDYQILNMPATFAQVQFAYLTACLLRFYQQLRIYEEKSREFDAFNLEKPLWVFVGSTVSKAKGGTRDEKIVAADVAQIICFIAEFLDNQANSQTTINSLLTGGGQVQGLLDPDGNDIFAGSFTYLARAMNAGESVDDIFRDILSRLFNNAAGGTLFLDRIKGESGEVALRVGTSENPFGLINVGDAKSLCEHVDEVAKQNGVRLLVEDSDFTEAMFASVKDSLSPVNMLIGSKKFIEGWDCWRVSTMGLMHVGKSEGSQIIQLFGRGIRLKGYEWSLKRSGHTHAPVRPNFIDELETLNVFGIEADFMEKFREFLREEGLPGNERRKIITIPLNVTYDFGKKLKILRPKLKASDGKEYDFKRDAPVPTIGDIPKYLTENPVISDWYPRIQTMRSRGTALASRKDNVSLCEQHLALLDYDKLFFELEEFKRERNWYNLNITKDGVTKLLRNSGWYTLYLPEPRLNPTSFDGVLLLQQVASELLKRYCDRYYNYSKREYIEPRLELRDIAPDDDSIPQEEFYQLIVDGDADQVIQGIQQIKKDLEQKRDDLLKVGDLKACDFGKHLFQPLFHVKRGGKITVLPVVLNESEYQFVTDLKSWCDGRKSELEKDGMELFLLRNMSRGKGVGFFEAGNFHPDFILWVLVGDKQYVTFIEPHGLLHEGPASEKVLFRNQIKDIEQRMKDPSVILNSFILSWTPYPQLKWEETRAKLEDRHVLFMTDNRDGYIDKLFDRLLD